MRLPSLKSCLWGVSGVLSTFADMSGGLVIVDGASRWLSGGAPDDIEITTPMMVGMGLALLAAIPNAIAMFSRVEIDHNDDILLDEQFIHDDDEEEPHEHEHDDEDHDHHHHGLCHTLMDIGVIGVPFALFGAASSKRLLQAFSFGETAQWMLGGLCGAMFGFGNYRLHGAHLHAEEGVLALLARVDGGKNKLVAVWHCMSLLLGHGFQGFLAAKTFFDTIAPVNDPQEVSTRHMVESGLSVLLGGIVMLTEGRSEMRSALQAMINNQNNRRPHRGITALLTLPALFHGGLALLGALDLTQMFYHLRHKAWLAQSISVVPRISIFAGYAGSLMYPNAKGAMELVRPAVTRLLVAPAEEEQPFAGERHGEHDVFNAM